MKDKMDRYLDLYNSRLIENEVWQPLNLKVFPHILILSNQHYAIDSSYPFRIMQAQSFTQFLQALKPKVEVKTKETPGEVKSNLKMKY
jgi:hypothetical protein